MEKIRRIYGKENFLLYLKGLNSKNFSNIICGYDNSGVFVNASRE